MNKTKCPGRLADAYDWTAAAGELPELLRLADNERDEGPLLTYCDESAKNNAGDVTSEEIYALALWLRSNREAVTS